MAHVPPGEAELASASPHAGTERAMAGATDAARAVRGRGLVVAGLLAVLLIAASIAWSAASTPGAGEPGTTLVMTDYAFAPSRLTWRAGDRVTLTVLNRSQAQPPKGHEIMFGVGPMREEGPFGPVQGDGFGTPLLDGVALEIEGGGGLSMLMTMGSEVTGLDPMMVLTPEAREMGMGGMSMNQFMAELDPDGSLTFSFVVPDRPGEWEFGCFAQDGQHYLNGMRGTITILPASASGS